MLPKAMLVVFIFGGSVLMCGNERYQFRQHGKVWWSDVTKKLPRYAEGDFVKGHRGPWPEKNSALRISTFKIVTQILLCRYTR
jgi:hypothetical protein